MKTSKPAASQGRQIFRRLLAALVAGCIVSVSLPVQADTIIYSQNFNSFSDGTPLTSVPGWYDWSGAQVPVIQGGKAVLANPAQKCDMLLNMTDIFSYGNNQARIEFDMVGGWENDVFFCTW